MKKLLLTFAVLLGFALPGLAETAVFYASGYTYTGSVDDKFAASSSTCPEQDILSWSSIEYGTSYLRINSGSTGTITPKDGITITKIEVYNSTSKSISKATITVDGTSTTINKNTTTNLFSYECNTTSPIKLTGTVGNTKNQLRIDYIEITYTKPVSGPKDFEPAFKNQAYTIYKDENLDINSLITVNTPPLSHLRAS